MTNIIIKERILVTGANGFVGAHLVDKLLGSGFSVNAAVRKGWSEAPEGVEIISVGDFSLPIDWSAALNDISTVIHLAARVHQMDESPEMALEESRSINTHATLELAKQAAKFGIKRFIYLSTIAINGAFTAPNEFFTEESDLNLKSSYAISKYEAELGLKKIAQQYPMEVVIIRPPMVYGKNAPGNFSRLVSLVKTRIPLPFGLANNLRSFIFIQNLVNFIVLCIEHPAAGNELFLASDDDDISLYNLICQISNNLQLRANVFKFHLGFLEMTLMMISSKDLSNQLLKPMRINTTKARKLLGWIPSFSSAEGLIASIKDR